MYAITKGLIHPTPKEDKFFKYRYIFNGNAQSDKQIAFPGGLLNAFQQENCFNILNYDISLVKRELTTDDKQHINSNYFIFF